MRNANASGIAARRIDGLCKRHRRRGYVPQAQRVRVKETGEFWRVNDLADSRVYAEELAATPGRWVMSFRLSMVRELERTRCLHGARAVWLTWPGYLGGESEERTRGTLERLGIELRIAHASGHATIEDLQRFAGAIDAGTVVPIHTDAA